ncbi:MAG: hypothetical protein JO002_01480, partial [Burkholderiaceae bacterium]|nr:hypothetical protein [Burkholderiaceae bacterium]
MMPNAPHDPAKRPPVQQAGRSGHPPSHTAWPEAVAPPPAQRLVPASVKQLPVVHRAARRRRFAEAWDWAVLISIVLHALIISLQFGTPGSRAASPPEADDAVTTAPTSIPLPPPPTAPEISPPASPVALPPGEFVVSLAPPVRPSVPVAVVSATPPPRSHAARQVMTASHGKWRVEKGSAAKAPPAALQEAPTGTANVDSPADTVSAPEPDTSAAQAVAVVAAEQARKAEEAKKAEAARQAEEARKLEEARTAAEVAAQRAAQLAAQKAQALAQAEQARKAEEAAAEQRARAQEEAVRQKAAAEAADKQRQIELA